MDANRFIPSLLPPTPRYCLISFIFSIFVKHCLNEFAINIVCLNVSNPQLYQSQSQARIEVNLDKLFAEMRSGKRTRSISSKSIGPISAGDKELWRQLQRELEDVGILANDIASSSLGTLPY
jgi:hypothetical protein